MASASNELVYNDTVGTLQSGTVDIRVDEIETIHVVWLVEDASVVAADMGSTHVYPYMDDGTLITNPLPTASASGKEDDGAVVSLIHKYDVRGFKKLQMLMVNNAAADRVLKIYVSRSR